MSKLKSAVLRFPVSGSPDVINYKLYVEADPDPVTYDSPSWNLGNDPVDGYIETDLSEVDGVSTMDGIYNIGVTSVDDAGNESSMSQLDSVPLDFVAPDPPGPLSLISG